MTEDESYWRGVVHSGAVAANRQWYERGRIGPGQLVVEGENLRGLTKIRSLRGARFVRCDLTHVALGQCMLDDVELLGCIFSDGAITESDLTRARIDDCNFDRCNLLITHFVAARVRLGSFRSANLLNTRWTSAHLAGVDFHGASFRGATLDSALFSDCDLRDVDFDDASVVGTTFQRCQLAGAHGKPRAGDAAPWTRVSGPPA